MRELVESIKEKYIFGFMIHVIKNKWSLKITTGAYSYTHDNCKRNHWGEFFICKETESIKGNFLTINIPQYC